MGIAGLPGAGPWRILAGCPARNHNSLAAADGRRGQPRCLCPRAAQMVAEKRIADRARLKLRSPRKKVRPPWLNPNAAPISASTVPDFTGGACTTKHGRDAALAGMNEQASGKGIKDRERAKRLCNTGPCPIRDKCRAWVLGQERPAGSWGAVWGGLDPWNRRGQQMVMVDGEPELIPFSLSVDK